MSWGTVVCGSLVCLVRVLGCGVGVQGLDQGRDERDPKQSLFLGLAEFVLMLFGWVFCEQGSFCGWI